MPIEQFAFSSHTAASLLFITLAFVFVRPWREGIYSPLFIVASLITASWHFSLSIEQTAQPTALSQVLATLHYAAWLTALLATLLLHVADEQGRRRLLPMYALLGLLMVAGALFAPYLIIQQGASDALSALIWANLLLGLLGIIVVEQVLRNTLDRQKQAVLFLCIGTALFFVFDIVFYANALLFSRIDPSIEEIRPVVNLIAGISLLFASTRSQHSSRVSISRKMVFYSASLIIAGVFLFVMAATAYYVKAFGGSWGAIVQVALLVGAGTTLLILFTSPNLRASIRVFINKNFFMHKYDYRTEWLNLINILSQPSADKDEKAIALDAACAVFHANSACLWLRTEEDFIFAASSLPDIDALPSVPSDSDFGELLAADWVFHPHGGHRNNANHNRALPEWLSQLSEIWVVVPLIAQQRLLGFISLCRQDNTANLSWEDLDVLKTVGRQLGSYLALHVAAEQLAQSKQFDTYNKLTAFIMHDLKNLIAQQALVVENAKKHKENPAFVEDAIKTIENSVARMSNLLSKMQQRGPSKTRSLELNRILLESVNKCRDKKPAPSLRMGNESVWVTGDHDHLVMIFAHVIKNAQEATPANGFVDVFVELDEQKVLVTVEDNGQGMAEDFIKDRLFRPFDTTKSGQGMGIGVFQTKEYIRNLGGDVKVQSTENVGTTFSITMPIVEEQMQHVG